MHRCVRACVRACVRGRAFAAWTRGGPAPPGLGLNSHVRSDDPASQACRPAKGILYLAMTRTRHEEAISPRRGGSGEQEGGREGGKGEKGEKGDSREEARVRYKDEAEGRGYTGRASERASERASGRAKRGGTQAPKV